MSKKKVAIIGGGLSGLSAGIYLQINGYDTEIIEKNAVIGGACIGWERKDCYIDGCIHWMTGTNPNSAYHAFWRQIHALTDETEVFFQTDFSTLDFGNGKRLTLWADLPKLREELLAFAPEDAKEIERFCKYIKRFKSIEGPVQKPVDLMNIGELCKIAFTMCGDYYWVKKLSRISCAEYAARFQNKHMQYFIRNFMSAGYNLMSLVYMLAHVMNRDGGIPIGGSRPMVQRVEARYRALGGKIRTKAEVERLRIEGRRVAGVELKSGEVLEADWVVSATPVEHSLKKLLGGRYAVKKIDKRLADMATYPIYTYTTAIFKCHADMSQMPLSLVAVSDTPITLDQPYDGITVRNYSYDKTMKCPDGTCVLQTSLRGDDDMYFWWKVIKEHGDYKTEKKRVGETLLAMTEKAYPELAGKLELIDVVTPCTYERYLNSRHGSFQGFVHTSKGKSLMERGVIKGLDNFFLAGQCIFQSGGMPPAVFTGRFAAQRICRADRKKFRCAEN